MKLLGDDGLAALLDMDVAHATLDAQPAARALFDELDAANRFAVLFRIHQATTPVKRADKVIEMVATLGRGETLHPRKQKDRNA